MAATAGQGVGDIMKPDGTLKHPITMIEEQGGFAGPKVTIYEIKADGSFVRKSYTRYVDKDGNEKKRGESTREGKLTKEHLDTVAKTLAEHKFVELPKKIGQEAKVNPRTVSIDYGEKRTTLSGDPVGQPGKAAAESKEGARFSAVAEAIKSPIEATGHQD